MRECLLIICLAILLNFIKFAYLFTKELNESEKETAYLQRF
ncbi:MAG: hypothetical protein Solivirus3_28 [Solivirus sp.]|uniref:Uncharacterized protein n=1 Tax=Solivirus sp. TaxID=2487772 RepID=A0A3G5AFX3_9VIRU|nr:MAG: hypothetical protein Solivirus3_28 [Solivirus sp.]